MFSKYLEKLEFNKVTENLATFSKTFIGKNTVLIYILLMIKIKL